MTRPHAHPTPVAFPDGSGKGGEPTPIAALPVYRGVQYHSFVCVECGAEATNTYCEPHRTDMLERRLCWTCNFWRDFVVKNAPGKAEMTIIDGHIYSPGNRTTGSIRGMAGRRFDIEYVEPSAYAGQRITTFDLWSGSTMPESIRPLFPDTARFLNNARRADVGGTGCWNPSDSRDEPYPLPRSLRPTAALSRAQGETE